MILQHIVFPQNKKKGTESLYYRSNKKIAIKNRYEAILPSDCFLELFSYFNSFSAHRWSAYTSVTEIEAVLILSGCGTVRLCHQTSNSLSYVTEKEFHSETEIKLCFHLEQLQKEGFYYLVIHSAKTSSVFFKKCFFATKKQSGYSVHLAIASCTYHREPYITANMKKISKEIFEQNSQLKNNLDIYIIDNGQTLCENQFLQKNIHLIQNENTGGSGGFTRGLIEILHHKEKKEYTHALLMDDDIDLDTETLERTYSFLCYLKKEYQDSTLGGAMLRNDKPCILEEAGANWKGYPESLGRGLNLSDTRTLFEYDSLQTGEYQAWWYCCIPLSLIDLTNLPLPFFIHGDDVEYGLRNSKRILQLNGICVWHDTFENKRSSSLEYYDIRNTLIVNSVCKKKISLIQQLIQQFKRSTAAIWRMRYDDVLLHVKGIEDFLNGPEWWSEQDIHTLHKKIMKNSYSYRPLSEFFLTDALYKNTNFSVSTWEKWRAFLTMNGTFFPKKKKSVLLACGSHPSALYRRNEAYLLEPESQTVLHVQFSLKRFFFSYGILLKACIKLCRQYTRLKKQYQKSIKEIGTERFWKHSCSNFEKN